MAPPLDEQTRVRPPGRFNEWGQKAYIVAPPEHSDAVEREVPAMRLTARARQLMRAARLTRSLGYEFVFISNAQFTEPLRFDPGPIEIVPCFRPFPVEGGGMADMNQLAMMGRGRFIYDGWIPDAHLSPLTLEHAVSQLDVIAGSVSLVGSYYAHWEPKYFARDPIQSFIVSQGEISSFMAALGAVATMPREDATALRRTIGWLSSAASAHSPVASFLHYFVALESLITYIERDAPPTSPLGAFAKVKATKAQRREEATSCISQRIEGTSDLVEAVKEAYFECVVSTRRLLEEHLKRILADQARVDVLFERGPSSRSLWDIRGRIAHGDLDLLSEAEVDYVAASLGAIEDVVRSYVRIVASQSTRSEFFSRWRRPVLSFSAAEGYGAPGSVYKGPTSMAELYLGTTDLQGPHVEVTFGS